MSITTKRGDDGGTDLMFGKRTAKVGNRIEAIGSLDELVPRSKRVGGRPSTTRAQAPGGWRDASDRP